MSKQFFWMLFCLALAGPAGAGEGIILINQAHALAGGVSPGDAAGYPVTLSTSGHYRLASNLTAADQNTNVIEITVDNVTLDLGGFMISGTNVCSLVGNFVSTPCAGVGAGNGVFSTNSSITIQNGLITGMGNDGVNMTAGAGFVLRNIAATHSGDDGFDLGFNPLFYDAASGFNGGDGIAAAGNGVLHATSSGINGANGISGGDGMRIIDGGFGTNGSNGISLGQATTLSNVVANSNGANGISVGVVSRISGCGVVGNALLGIAFASYNGVTASGYEDCVITSNTGGTVTAPGIGFGEGIEFGTNVCGLDNTCP